MTKVKTRFAPSPTGALHIGGARTALFNWLFARHHDGEFLLRIEDTDRARSTPENVDVILNSLEWLGLDYDDEPVSQYERAEHHARIAQALVQAGQAYYCYASQDELAQLREEAEKKAETIIRNQGSARAPDGNICRGNSPTSRENHCPTEGEQGVTGIGSEQ